MPLEIFTSSTKFLHTFYMNINCAKRSSIQNLLIFYNIYLIKIFKLQVYANKYNMSINTIINQFVRYIYLVKKKKKWDSQRSTTDSLIWYLNKPFVFVFTKIKIIILINAVEFPTITAATQCLINFSSLLSIILRWHRS